MPINIKGFTIAANTSGFEKTKKSFEEIADICLKAGFIGIEGEPPLFDKKSDQELEQIGKLFKNAGLVIETFHLPYTDPVKHDIATLYEVDRKKVADLLKRTIDQAALLGTSVGILHPTTRKDYLTEEEGIDRIMLQAGKTLEAVLKHCEQYKFKIAVENMLPYRGDRLGCKLKHLEEIIKRFDHPLLGFCMDTGHSLVSFAEKAMDVFHFMKNKLIAFHLADNAGDRDSHLAPGHGNFFWKEFFGEVEKIGYRGTMCVETPPFSYGPNYSIEAWQTMRKELKTLSNF
ncbi:MAG: sugar phosphate isomerase/epimerase [Spirochaetaceae bacterium]|nr:sugar phosphate isomerase/epimerase [Spirochaetaceae bacterium]